MKILTKFLTDIVGSHTLLLHLYLQHDMESSSDFYLPTKVRGGGAFSFNFLKNV